MGERREIGMGLLHDVGVKLSSTFVEPAEGGVEVAALLLCLEAALVE